MKSRKSLLPRASKQLAHAHATHPIAAVQLEWPLRWHEPEHSTVPAARELDIELIPRTPQNRKRQDHAFED